MTPALTALAWTLVLALVQILLPAGFRNRETGAVYNTGPRDDPGPPVGKVTGRLRRAQANLYETLPLFGFAVLIAWAADRETHVVDFAAWTYLAARVVYVPLYGFGVPKVRSLAWGVGLLALFVILYEVLVPMTVVL
jgi:uncharacterized MAPEG superfamily protein